MLGRLLDQLTFSYFTHPASVCMSYAEHFRFSLKITLKLAIGTGKSLIHSVYPDAFRTSTTDLIKDIEEEMKEVGCR